jgi:hypothetical protein
MAIHLIIDYENKFNSLLSLAIKRYLQVTIDFGKKVQTQ